jgi:hypothetical protein
MPKRKALVEDGSRYLSEKQEVVKAPIILSPSVWQTRRILC